MYEELLIWITLGVVVAVVILMMIMVFLICEFDKY